jgi:hypothetical protein
LYPLPSSHSSITNTFPRETASKILNEYLEKVGGKEAILAAWQEKKDATKKGKKRSRASTGAEATNGTKRGKKNGHPKDESPPASASKAEWKPPTGSWEEHVTGIDACEGNDNNVVVYLTWKGGHKTQHPLAAVYKRCPQKMLKFYESHLFVKPTSIYTLTNSFPGYLKRMTIWATASKSTSTHANRKRKKLHQLGQAMSMSSTSHAFHFFPFDTMIVRFRLSHMLEYRLLALKEGL